MKNSYLRLILPAVMSFVTAAHAADYAPQAWQIRRAEFGKIVQGINQGDASAVKKFDDVLTEFDTSPQMSRTPLENMEILGLYYVPREGVEKTLPVIVKTALLGWYDALRFASASGKAEISQGLFMLPIAMGGPEARAKAAKFFAEQPARTEQMVSQGVAFAARNRGKVGYDQHWPTAFGLERMICAEGGACDTIPPLPESQWDAAWAEAEKRVRAYYRGDAKSQVIK